MSMRLRWFREVCFTIAVGLVACCASDAAAQDGGKSCKSCHAGEAGKFGQSVHTSLQCQDCHGGNESYPDSVSSGASGAFDHGSSFRGRPTRAKTPDLCGNCHADVERMNPYGIRTDQLARYWTSVHGKVLSGRHDDRVAVCTDCHGVHEILRESDPNSSTHPLNVPGTCGHCHENAKLMGDFGVPTEVVDEYRRSVHGRLLLERGDTGAPTCATCHGNHSAMPPGFATVGAVCGQCHEHVAANFATSIHARQPEFKGCVQCHGGGEGRHFHLIERITKPAGVMIQRYANLLTTDDKPTAGEIDEAINPNPKRIIEHALPTCLECHDELEEDESLPKLFGLLDEIAAAERRYVEVAHRLNEVGRGVLLVEDERFKFEGAKTHLIELAPLQHTLNNKLVAEKVDELNEVCDQVDADLDGLELGLKRRRMSLVYIWAFSILFSAAIYAKYKQLKAAYVVPVPKDSKSS